MRRLAAGLVAALPLAAGAVPVELVPHATAAALTTGVADFETLPPLPEPGHDLDHGFAFPGGRAGERFAGQPLARHARDGALFDAIPDTVPGAPLALDSGAPGHGLSVSFHRAFRSNALYPLGPAGWPDADARGEGAVAFLFDRDVCAVAMRIHTEYTDDLGTAADHRGIVRLRFFSRDAILIDDHALSLGAGITDLGLVRRDGVADIAGLLVTNLDPGGISLDDVRFGCVPVTG